MLVKYKKVEVDLNFADINNSRVFVALMVSFRLW